MALLIEELAQQVLEQTRVVVNGPVLQPEEALRCDVIPGGGAGGQSVNDVLNLGTSNPLASLHLSVTYAISRTGGGVVEHHKVPGVSSGHPGELLSAAFVLAPRVKLVKSSRATDLPSVGLPTLDHKLTVTLTVSSPQHESLSVSRTVEAPFAIPTVILPLPVVPAVCICAQDANLGGSKYLIMVPPGAPSSVAQIVSAYNSVLDAFNALESVLELISFVLSPLKLVTSTLAKIPTPYITTTARVQDFDDYDDFDDEMTSFLLVAPTGYAVRFSDTANPGDWDDFGDNGWRTYAAVDVLQLPSHPHGTYLMERLTLDAAKVSELADAVATLTGVPVSEARLGLGVFYIHNLASSSTPHSLRHYETSGDTDEEVNDDTESAMWVTTGEG